MSETVKDQETSSEQGNAGRRRLVRGAMALAPVVLTLRSGALAAASCTGVRQVVGLDNQGRFRPLGGAQVGDLCVTKIQVNGCPVGKIDSGVNSGVSVTQSQNPNMLECQGLINQEVAILSATAAGSLFPAGG